MLGYGASLPSTGKAANQLLPFEQHCSVMDSLFPAPLRDVCCNHAPLVLCSWQTWRL